MAQRRLGDIIRAAREKRGLSVYALAETSGVDRGLLWRIERGAVRDPKPDNLAKIAEALGMSVTDLYAKAGYSTTPPMLPTLPAYLRAKYGYLPQEKQREVIDFFKQIEAEYGPPKRSPSKRSKKGGGDGDHNQ